MTDDRKMLSTLALGTITTGITMVEKFEGVGEAFEWVLGRPIWTHEIPGVRDEAAALILAQLPEMPTEVHAGDGGWQVTRADLLTKYGEQIEVQRGTSERTESPAATLGRMLGGSDD